MSVYKFHSAVLVKLNVKSNPRWYFASKTITSVKDEYKMPGNKVYDEIN